ncbi:MAG TPA: TetR/AcrR family transcriptional regulator [Bacillota bacterium]|nr:TetR/AcrR family transcriptional regulator [Bacillota bacterium]
MPGRSSRPAIHSEDKRQSILDAALALFNERGFHATNVPQIAERAGVAVGTIYHHFPSKEAIVNELYRTLKSDMSRAMLENFPFEAPMRQQFHEYWQRLTDCVRQDSEAFFFVEVHHHAPYLDEESRAIHIPMMEAFERVCQAAREQGVLRDISIEIIMALTMGTLTALVKTATEGKMELTPEVLEKTENCLWDAISCGTDKEGAGH